MSQPTKNPQKVATIFRWVAVLPSAVLAGIVIHLLVIFINNISVLRFIDAESFLALLYIHSVSNIVFGAISVWVAAYVAPKFKMHVSLAMAGIFLLISGAVILWFAMQSRYWEIYAMVCTDIGSISMAIYLFKNGKKQVEKSESEEFQQALMEVEMGSQFEEAIVTEYAERGEGTGGLSKILSGLIFPILTVLAVQLIVDQQYIPLVLLAILMWTNFGIFVMAAGLIYFLATQYWMGVIILAVYFLISILSVNFGKRNIKRLLLSGRPMISPFESMPDLMLILIFQCLFLALALLTYGWISGLFWCLCGLIITYHIGRFFYRLHPRWNQIHQPLMVRYAAAAGQEIGQAEREGREFSFSTAIISLFKSVYPDKREEEIEAMMANAVKKMDFFADRDLIKQTMQKGNSSIPGDKVQDRLDKLEKHLKTDEGRKLIVRYAIAEIVEVVFGHAERGAYLLAVIEGKAS